MKILTAWKLVQGYNRELNEILQIQQRHIEESIAYTIDMSTEQTDDGIWWNSQTNC